MKKAICFALVIVMLAAGAAAAVLYAYNSEENFTGDRVKNPDSYILAFERMNGQDSHSLSLKEGDALSVEFSVEKGRVDLAIENDSGNAIYKGNKIEDGIFEVIIPADGEYTVSVNAKNARGEIRIGLIKEEKQP